MAKPAKKVEVKAPVKAKGSNPNFAPRKGKVNAATYGVSMTKQQKIIVADVKSTQGVHQAKVVGDLFMKAMVTAAIDKKTSKKQPQVIDTGGDE
jgi:hypothetical protein